MAICDNPDCAVELENPIIVNEFTSCAECEYIFESLPQEVEYNLKKKKGLI